MKQQLTFDEYRDAFYPGWRTETYSGFSDPNEGRWYRWLESGHAEKEKAERDKRAEEYTQKAIAEQSKREQIYDALLKEHGETHLEEMLKILYGKNFMLDMNRKLIDTLIFCEQLKIELKGTS